MPGWEIIDNAETRDGDDLLLARVGERWEVRSGYRMLMSSELYASEQALAELAFAKRPDSRRVLIGGLGLGFTLRAALDLLGDEAEIVVAETSDALVRWNRTHLAEVARRPLEDRRARLRMGDVAERIAESMGAYDAILLDVDNGPTALVHSTNDRLYGDDGVRACHRALSTDGVLAVWSAHPDDSFLSRLQRCGFDAEQRIVGAGDDEGTEHVIFLAVKLA